MPLAVLNELADQDAPPPVRAWITNPPTWIEMRKVPGIFDGTLARLDDGEREAITIAVTLSAESLLLMDDREGALEARRRGLAVTGTLGVLHMAAKRGLLNLAIAFARLRATNFRCPEEIMSGLLIDLQRGGE